MIFSIKDFNIIADDRVTSNLNYCFNCYRTGENNKKYSSYLTEIIEGSVKQCPICKAIYILKDPK